MRKIRFILPVLFFISAVGAIWAQTPSHYDQHKAFDPFFYPSFGTVYRSATGEPGPKYWSNSADYAINTTLDTTKHELSGAVTITYTNNTPDNLPFLWLQLDQNIYRKDSPGEATNPVPGGRWSNRRITTGELTPSPTI